MSGTLRGMSHPALSIVVLQWNRHDLTRKCVDSIRDHTSVDHELIIVDNGSDPDSARYADAAADVCVLLKENVGFARGMNAGLEVARADTVAFVNNDTEFPSGWAERMTALAHTENVGIVAPAVTSAGNASSVRASPGDRIRNARPFIDLPSAVVYGMATDFIRRLGGWQTDYPTASSEDLDLLFATWCTGREVIIDDMVLVDHLGSATADTLKGKGRLWRQNRQVLVQNWRDMDEDSFRSRYRWDGPVSASRLEEARIAAYWMGRFFDAADAQATQVAPHADVDESGSAPKRRRFGKRSS